MSWVTHFEALISSDFILPRQKGMWQLQEPGAGHALFEINGGASVGFTLDQKSKNAFPYFKDAAPVGMRQVNDGLVVADIEGQTYVVAIEMKTSKGECPKALKQIESGRRFVAWVAELSELNGHGAGGYQFVGLISLKPRTQPAKGLTRRSAELPEPEESPHGYPVFVLHNHPRTSVQDLVKKLAQAT